MKKIKTFEEKKVLILGLAKSGEAAARLLHTLGAHVTVNDGKAFEENPAAQALLEEGIEVICGSHPLELLDEDFDFMVKNPGIRYDNPMINKALDKKIPVITEVELAYLVSEAPIIGITGTNGKTTTTTLIADILNADGQSAKLAGNIGFPASEVAAHATAQDTLVMELSSFQLMGIVDFKPQIALITNIFSSHLDYHGSQEAYEAAKWRIQENLTSEQYLILNFNQDKCRTLAEHTAAQVVPFATENKVNGAYSLEGKLYFRDEFIMEAVDLALPGEHNLENALAAIAVAKLSGAKNEAIIEVLTSFSGVKHRLQYLGELAGRKVYNDSKATNILATEKALSGFENSRLWLLAGGLDRGNGFEELADSVTGIKGMVLFGETAPKLQELADQLQIPTLHSENVATALKEIFEKTADGDTILLSPACASWDQYKTFEERGDMFIKAFEELKGEWK
ncbi:UDP-N-acetylmuramoyl-L-alanine--D-glutamate ligase [Lactococcus formosensis]|uniref:UDP-N-acetylmuramoyl-L-alanine--D-glutamate ligase n=1 Tax=Lactococcus formosensis TaxID=1281486 RepID=UPI0013FE4B96|nr:UDP-N-acetylmuramoyl-L-alanine--D-glutamate ligase [Lactococcus formosensis]MDT2725636.1 UDP-N-acetylmuramoyl-L-alanine--D-glutamate ligase [Lactococcus formosensis]NHI66883.1 UDP-N-acetylmuramoyl-L-alanine--D-glutamate ligase [Lactococcus garvieae]NHI99337.1 UDP-N-acetylmuramoyl-L-alanine--D-glutamate ligase [Lactococcus garvieae]NHJ17474.1 UDP-N-acetylmuramoyl-L-alanine--D-glutamate ligase [Lactococcus garvieae]